VWGVGIVDTEDETTVGPGGQVLQFAHQLAPGLVEKMMARQTRKAFDDAKPEPNTWGAVQAPEAKGTTVGGGWGETKQ